MTIHQTQKEPAPAYRRIPLSGIRGKGKYTLVDHEDYEHVKQHRWHLDMNGCARCAWEKNGKKATLCLQEFLIPCPPDYRIKHVNGDKLDNRRCNLRVTPRTSPSHPKYTSRYRGVYLRKAKACATPRWVAQITYKRKTLSLGCYTTEEEAARAYDAKARDLKGDAAKLNFPLEDHDG